MYTNLTENNLIQPCQSGFRSLHSTVPAFLVMTNQWCLTLIGGVASGVIFLDLKKAFDINRDFKIRDATGSKFSKKRHVAHAQAVALVSPRRVENVRFACLTFCTKREYICSCA